MSERDRPTHVEGEHDRAVERLYAAVEEQSRVRDKRDGAGDTPEKEGAEVSLRAADDEVLARERWLKAVDDHDY